jgi:hypothetical protein
MTPAELENFDFSAWAQSLRVDAIPAVLAQLASVQTALAARLIAAINDIGGGNAGPNRQQAAQEWSLSIDDMIRMTSKSRRWLFNHRHLPFIRSVSRKTIIGDESLLRRWISQQRA